MWHVAVVGRAMFTSKLIVKLGVCTYVCEVKEGGLEKLADPEGALDTKQRRPWEHNPPFRDGVDADGGGVEVLEPSEEARVGVGEGGHIAKILDVGAGELVALDELEALCEAGEDGELALERVLAEEEVKDAWLFVEVRLPVRVLRGGEGRGGGRAERDARRGVGCNWWGEARRCSPLRLWTRGHHALHDVLLPPLHVSQDAYAMLKSLHPSRSGRSPS